MLLTNAGIQLKVTGGGAVSFDASTNQTTSESYSHTTPAGSNRLLIVWIQTNSGDDPTAVTYNGVSMTKIASETVVVWEASLWYLVAPATGSNTISITSTFGTLVSCVMSFSNVDQSTPYSGYVTNQQTGTNSNDLSVTISSVGASDMALDGAYGQDGTYNVNSGQTQISNQATGSVFSGSSYEVGTGGNMTQNWTRPFLNKAEMFGLRLNQA